MSYLDEFHFEFLGGHYNAARGTREAIAKDGTSFLEFSDRYGVPIYLLEQGLSATELSRYTRFSARKIYEMGHN